MHHPSAESSPELKIIPPVVGTLAFLLVVVAVLLVRRWRKRRQGMHGEFEPRWRLYLSDSLVRLGQFLDREPTGYIEQYTATRLQDHTHARPLDSDMGRNMSALGSSSDSTAFIGAPDTLTMTAFDAPARSIPSKSERKETPLSLGEISPLSPSSHFEGRRYQSTSTASLSQESPSAWGTRGRRGRADNPESGSYTREGSGRRDASFARSTVTVSSTARSVGMSTLPPPYAEYE